MKNINYSIYLVTDENCLHGRNFLECIEEALKAGITLLQYRGKNKSGKEMYNEALALKKLCSKYHIPLIVNDRIDIALLVNADGVHLGQDDIPCREARKILGNDYIIGVSAHNVDEAKQAVLDGADYLGSGAVFGSATKNNVQTLGINNLRNICHSVKIPVVGIGGINSVNYNEVLKAKASGAAVISSILGSENIADEVNKFKKVFTDYESIYERK